MFCVFLSRATLIIFVILCFIHFFLLVVVICLTVPVQVIDWKDSPLKCVGGNIKLH